ncbi:MAG: hypothetical protein APR62_03310 [Smithella sp. SDB]|nr:MAG: hypothetical protein APR62_03310 [Smithella sp. SDB]
MKKLRFNKETGEKGFTLFEIIIALAISMVVMAAIYASVNMAQKSSSSVTKKVITQQDARAILDIMAMEIRMASFNPNPPASTSTWDTIPTHTTNANCPDLVQPCPGQTSPPSCKTYKGIQVAGPNQIHISMDLDGSGVIGNAPNEHILYTYSSINNAIYRNVSCGGNQPILGGKDDSETKVINDESTPLFQYFDRDGNSTTSIPDIRRIRITIIAQTKSADMLSGRMRVIPYTTDILVKNHVLSP